MGIGVHVCYANTAAGPGIDTASKNTIATTTGNTIIVFARAFSGDFHATTPIGDSAGNTWTLVGTELSAGGSKYRTYKAVNITGSGTHSFQSLFLVDGYGSLFVCEITGVGTNPTVLGDQQEDTATPFDSPSIAPGAACVLLGMFGSNAGTGTEVDTWGGSFASGDKIESYGDADNRVVGSMAAVVKGSGGTYNSSVTVSGVTVTNPGIAVVSVETSGGGYKPRCMLLGFG